jgi:hypothetical protein
VADTRVIWLRSTITGRDLDRLYASLAGDGLSLSTIRGVHAGLSKALADAERKGMVARNVARLASHLRRQQPGPLR